MPSDHLSDGYDEILQDYQHPEQKPEQPEDLKQLSKDLTQRFEDSYESRIRYENDWEFYRLYLKGEQLIARNRDTGETVKLSEDDSKRLRSLWNLLRPTARSLVGKLTRIIPTCTVLPATADFDEQHGARVADALLEYARRKEELDLKYLEACEYLPWAGNAFFQLHWDRLGGAERAWCQVCNFDTSDTEMIGQPCPQCTEQKMLEQQIQQTQFQTQQASAMADILEQMPPGTEPEMAMLGVQDMQPPPIEQQGPLPVDQPPPQLEAVYEGDVKVLLRDPRNIYIEPGANAITEANWICVREALPVPELRQMFPEAADWIHREENLHVEHTAEIRYNSLDTDGDVEELRDHAYLYEFHERPTWGSPDGRVIYMVNDVVVRILDPSPYYKLLRRFPVYHFGFDRNPGEVWFEPPLAQAWHRQRELNRVETQVREHTELCLKPKMKIPTGCRITEEEITSHTAQILKYNPAAGEPMPLEWPDLPMQVFARRNDLAADVRMQLAVTESEGGGAPADPNGRAMAIIEAEADQQIAPMLLRNFCEWREVHRGYLELFRTYAHPEVKWSVPGPEGVQTYSFEELMLSPGYDVQIEQDDGLSRNPAIRLQQSIDLLNAGVFMDPMNPAVPDIKAFMRHAKVNLPSAGYDMERTERSAASQIPYLMEQGLQHTPQPENDPLIFAEELLGWLRGPGRKKEQENPQLVMQVRQIWMYYAQWAMAGVPMDAGAMGMGMGAGAGPGGPDQSAQGGSANNPGHLGSDISGEAGQQVRTADAQAEGQARVTAQREG
jgi:hypothetical protein